MIESIANITSIEEDQIKLDISGELVTIKNTLESLQAELVKRDVYKLQTANTIYNIGNINNASFDMIQGRKVFNFELIKEIINTLAHHNPNVMTFLQAAKKDSPDWERVDKIRRVALEHIESSFIGVIRIQLRKLFAIGLESMSEVKLEKYIYQSHQLINSIIRLFNFILVKRLREETTNLADILSLADKDVVDPFFTSVFELSAMRNYRILEKLIAIHNTHGVKLFMPELVGFANEVIANAVDSLSALEGRTANPLGNAATYSFTDCAAAEAAMVIIFSKLGFLINYKMVVINGVAYEEVYHKENFYVHKYSLLETDPSPKTNKISYEKQPIPSNAVMIYKDDYRSGINLFPFLIDLNSMTEEGYPKLYFFARIGDAPNILTYEFIEGGQFYKIAGSGRQRSIIELNEEMTDIEKRKNFKQDMVYEIFMEDKSAVI